MLKVLYLINHAGKAGTERYVHTLAGKLHGKKIEAFFAYNEEGLLVERMKALGIPCHRIEMRSRFDLRAAWRLSRLCRELGIEIIHTQFLRENYIALLSRVFNPKVSVVYTNHFILRNNLVTRISNRLLAGLQGGVIAVCHPGKDMMVRNGMDGRKITVIHNAVDVSLWQGSHESTLRKEFNITEEACVLLCASRFAHDKGHAFLVDALHAMGKTPGPDYRCILAGDGPLLEGIKQKVVELGLTDKVIFTGFRKDIENLLFGSDLYINSSEHEALSFLIIEAMAAGLPVIATDMGGNRDIINEETGCGLLVRYNDAAGLALAIRKLMEDKPLRRRMSENAVKAVMERFNLDIAAEKAYSQYLRSLE